MTVLYLFSEKRLELSLDGPALAVRKAGEAARLFPLRRLERIHLDHRMEISSTVLLGCVRAGAILCFCDARRRPLAWMLPPASGGPLKPLVERLTRRADWEEEYRRWSRRQLHRIFGRLASRFPGVDATDPRAVEREAVRRALRHAGEADHRTTADWLATEAEGLFMKTLLTRGLAPEAASVWAARLAPLLRWSAEAARLHWLARRHSYHRNRRLAVPPVTPKEFNGFLQSEAQALPEVAEALLNRFELWLQEIEKGPEP